MSKELHSPFYNGVCVSRMAQHSVPPPLLIVAQISDSGIPTHAQHLHYPDGVVIHARGFLNLNYTQNMVAVGMSLPKKNFWYRREFMLSSRDLRG